MAGSDTSSSNVAASILYGASGLYGTAVSFRDQLFKDGVFKAKTLPCPVISVGNITVGGTGKTPMTVFLAKRLKEKGLNPVILSRGYGGTESGKGGMVGDGNTITMKPFQSGDEPFLMSSLLKGVPVYVGKNRFGAGMDAVRRFVPDLFILDDGFQHRNLQRNLNILLFDSERPFGNGFLIPRGTLREPVSCIERGDLFVLTRSKHRMQSIAKFREFIARSGINDRVFDIPVFVCRHVPVIRGIVKAGTRSITEYEPENIPGKDVFAFSGIAKNVDFRNGLVSKGFHIKGFIDYPDHHAYDSNDLNKIESHAASNGSRFLATTEKDYVRIQNDRSFSLDLLIMGVELDFGTDEEHVMDHVYRVITEH